jgi:hypothetical protein
VTFDTNTFDKVVRPSVYPNDPSYPDFVVVHAALKRGDALGFISETIITLEGLGKDQRAQVLGTTDLQRRTEQVSEDKFVITLTTEQAARQPLHPKQAERFVAAFDFGLRLLGTARIGMPRVEGDFYAFEAPEALGGRLNRFHDIMRASPLSNLSCVSLSAFRAFFGSSACLSVGAGSNFFSSAIICSSFDAAVTLSADLPNSPASRMHCRSRGLPCLRRSVPRPLGVRRTARRTGFL